MRDYSILICAFLSFVFLGIKIYQTIYSKGNSFDSKEFIDAAIKCVFSAFGFVIGFELLLLIFPNELNLGCYEDCYKPYRFYLLLVSIIILSKSLTSLIESEIIKIKNK